MNEKGDTFWYVVGTKLTRRILRRAFKRYKEATVAARVDWYGLQRGLFGHQRIRLNATRRMFDALRKYSRAMLTAKSFLRKAMMNADLRSKKSYFDVWSR